MINLIWFAMIAIAFVTAAVTGSIEAFSDALFASAEQAVSVVFSMVSIMTFWLGMMRIIEKSGFIQWIVKLLRPLSRLLFPRLPQHHPAMHAILMNMSANLLGMGNAATPFGLKAMQELQHLNDDPQTASDEMCTFLAVNTSALTLLPTTVVALRAASGSLYPTEIVGTTFLATLCGVITAIVADKFFRGLTRTKRKRR